ncbi:GntR family transcriptional regulator [Lacticaseibacillus paracasei]|uniref:Transcriptional regulator, GntR family n=1 Tax=Lacticaseibacillus paracasei (strain ATCC 334 / BCRC 17002 / CCUG 31169 / CIP 107868 / KCTC 3260 / NRRL B-441) TaxID=321967 RepID=Q033U2_LACP3|nr:GntR family transcriptional regulator [Lacticaseibacillus paracasei]ABJ71530.1 transcriptional regulator, GntR family [Lacticaseibacillus paracasei ATCC 334]KRK17090.1 transcriptional regulator [Lacticaseibacillus casei DSM 20011 = JCM 1134 = ATCC 393]OSY81307.1 GntR family transcriptional regulator [Lacticaseibacillus paracasei]
MYHDIAEQLIQDILAGKYPVKLPTEQVLMNRYQASRNTIRKALDVIFAHGLVRRVQGSGYYVIDHSEQSSAVLNMSIGFDQTAMVKGGPLKSKVVKFALIPATAALARRGNVAVGDPVYQVVRLRYLKGQLYDLEESYFPQIIVPHLSAEIAAGSIFTYLRNTYDMVGSTTENYIQSRPLPAEYADLMTTSGKGDLLCLDGINYLASGKVFNFSRTYFVYPGLTLYYHTTGIDLDQ